MDASWYAAGFQHIDLNIFWKQTGIVQHRDTLGSQCVESETAPGQAQLGEKLEALGHSQAWIGHQATQQSQYEGFLLETSFVSLRSFLVSCVSGNGRGALAIT